MLTLLDARDERVDVECVGAERPGRNLAVEDSCSDVGIVCRRLAPADGPPVSVVNRTKHTNSLANVSRQAIFIRPFPRAAPARLARFPVRGPSARARVATG